MIAKFIFLYCICGFFSYADSQPLPSPEQWGDYQVEVSPGCFAFSHLSNDRSRFNWAWDGPCLEGRANGEGVRTVYFRSIALSVAQARFKNGNLESFGDRYYFEAGILYSQKGPDNPMTARKLDYSKLPSWSEALINSIPIWKNWNSQDIEFRKNNSIIKNENKYNEENERNSENIESGAQEDAPQEDAPQERRPTKKLDRIFEYQD